MRRRWLAVAIGLALAGVDLRGTTADPPGGDPAKPGAVVVRVSARSGAPVAGADVTAWTAEASMASMASWTVAADANGVARFDGLPPGEVAVRADAPRLTGEEKEVDVDAGGTVEVSLVLGPGTPVSGVVLSEETGQPVAGADVTVQASRTPGDVAPHHRAPYARTRTDGEGRFRVGGVPEGETATAEAAANGYATGAAAVRISKGIATPSSFAVKLAPGGSITGSVKDPQGKPAAGAVVYVFPASSQRLRENPHQRWLSSTGESEQAFTAVADAGGAFSAERLPLGVVYAAVAQEEGLTPSVIVEPLSLDRDHRSTTADLALRPPSGLVVRLVDLAGKAVTEDAVVSVGERLPEKKRRPDRENAYGFPALRPGEYPVRVDAPSFLKAWAKAVVEAGKTTELVVRLDPGATLAGTVVDEEGHAVAGATVTVELAEGEEPSPGGWKEVPILGHRHVESGPDGTFVFRGLPPKDAKVAAWRRDAKDRLETLEAALVRAPATDVRVVVVRRASAAIRLLLPDGTPFVETPDEREKAGVLVTRWRKGDFQSLVHAYEHPEGGVLEFPSLEEGETEIEIEIRTHRFVPVVRAFVARLRTRLDLGDVVLELGVPVTGTVVDLAGAPLAGAIVLATPVGKDVPEGGYWLPHAGGGGWGTGITTSSGEDGAYVLPHVPRGRVYVEAFLRGRAAAPIEIDVAGPKDRVEIRLGEGAAVWCMLRAKDGKPGADERLVATRWGEDGKPFPTGHREFRATSDEGKAGFRLAPGRWRISLRTGAHAEVPLGDWMFAEGETRTIDLTIPPR